MLLDHSESGGLRNQALRSAQVVRIASMALKDVAGLVNGDSPRTARAQSLRARRALGRVEGLLAGPRCDLIQVAGSARDSR
jgi:hypothetical protein